MKVIVICSGGLDSVSLAHRAAAEHELLGVGKAWGCLCMLVVH